MQSPAAAAAAASVTAAYALSKTGKLESVDVESKFNGVVSTKDVEIEIEAIKEEKNVLELSLAEVKAENSKLKGAIEEVNGTHAELGKVSFFLSITCKRQIFLVT